MICPKCEKMVGYKYVRCCPHCEEKIAFDNSKALNQENQSVKEAYSVVYADVKETLDVWISRARMIHNYGIPGYDEIAKLRRKNHRVKFLAISSFLMMFCVAMGFIFGSIEKESPVAESATYTGRSENVLRDNELQKLNIKSESLQNKGMIDLPAFYGKKAITVHLEVINNQFYKIRENGRYGYETYVPSVVTKAIIAEDDSEITFMNDDQSVIFVITMDRNDKKTARSLYGQLEKYYGQKTVHYGTYDDGWFAMAGIKNKEAYYIKGLVHKDVYAYITFKYPESMRPIYDDWNTVLEEHFRLY